MEYMKYVLYLLHMYREQRLKNTWYFGHAALDTYYYYYFLYSYTRYNYQLKINYYTEIKDMKAELFLPETALLMTLLETKTQKL